MQNEATFSSNGNGTAVAVEQIMPKRAVSQTNNSNVTEFPKDESKADVYIPWWKRQLYYGGFLTMAGTPRRPPGFYVNIQTATFFIVVLSAIAGLWLYTKDTYQKKGYQDRQIEELQEKIKATDTKAEDARKAAYVNESEEEDLTPTPTPKKEKR